MTIPFYNNTKDDTHCVQACLKSVLKFYFPQKDYSFNYLDKVTAHKKGKWTWNSAFLLFLANKDFEVINIEDFNYKKFSKYGESFLKKNWTEEMFLVQKKFSDLKNEQKLAGKLVQNKKVILKMKPAMLHDIRLLFKKGYILLSVVNPYVLERRKGYASHLVVIISLGEKTITFHDPGLPPLKNRKTSLKLFLKAMRYPSKESANLIAVKKIH